MGNSARRLSSQLSGAAAEYLVAAELSQRGWIASLVPRSSIGIDLLAWHPVTLRQVSIQVKSRQFPEKKWLLSEKAERLQSPTLFYVLVDLRPSLQPSFYIVPSAVVAAYAQANHRLWMDTPRRDGAPHKESERRAFLDESGAYLGRWNLLDGGEP